MGEQGFLGTSIAAEKGGIGGTFKDEAIVLEEQIYANCHAPAIGVSIQLFFTLKNDFENGKLELDDDLPKTV